MLARLDGETLSPIEIAAALRDGGFDEASFFAFAATNAEAWLREAADEGPHMEAFANALLEGLRTAPGPESVAAARERGSANYRARPLDEAAFEALEPALCLNLTGDQTAQPVPGLARRVTS